MKLWINLQIHSYEIMNQSSAFHRAICSKEVLLQVRHAPLKIELRCFRMCLLNTYFLTRKDILLNKSNVMDLQETTLVRCKHKFKYYSHKVFLVHKLFMPCPPYNKEIDAKLGSSQRSQISTSKCSSRHSNSTRGFLSWSFLSSQNSTY